MHDVYPKDHTGDDLYSGQSKNKSNESTTELLLIKNLRLQIEAAKKETDVVIRKFDR